MIRYFIVLLLFYLLQIENLSHCGVEPGDGVEVRVSDVFAIPISIVIISFYVSV
jgi:hypothetical protein